jgi:hypothetical protein
MDVVLGGPIAAGVVVSVRLITVHRTSSATSSATHTSNNFSLSKNLIDQIVFYSPTVYSSSGDGIRVTDGFSDSMEQTRR